MDVSFIGSGNLAWHLAPALDNTDYHVREVYSRNARNADALVKRLYHATVKSTLDFSDSASQVFILAVPDDVIADIAHEIVLPDDAILVHTSGSQPLNILEDSATSRLGVFYPLQTFSRNRKIDFSETPVFVESASPEIGKILVAMGKAISKKVSRISSGERKVLHIAAVFASNFTNHMLTIAGDILTSHKLDLHLLKPLIAETINKALALGPDASQTGPAKRGDLQILDKHMEFLAKDHAVAEIYRAVSQHIVDRYES